MNEGSLWYLSTDGKTQGPFPGATLSEMIRSGKVERTAYVYNAETQSGSWVPIGSVAHFATAFPSSGMTAPPPPPARALGRAADEIDFEVFGEEMQFVEITLDPNEACIAEAGSFMYMDPGIEMETIFGDGSQRGGGGFMEKLFSAGKRLLTGESLFMTAFGNTAPERRKVAFAAPYPGKIIPLDLRQHDGVVLCQKDSFLCAAKGISVGIELQRKLGTGFFGGEGFILQKLEGSGLAFVHAGGTIVARQLRAGETMRLDTGCLVAFERQVGYDIQYVGNIKTALFGGEGLFFASLTGPGRVWIQSLPFSRLAGRILASATQVGMGRSGGEGSLLGGFGLGDE